jgi:hypothetical protein
MFGSGILEVAVGLAFVYFALSTLASHINEKVAGTLSWRAKDLEKGIHNLLGEPTLSQAVWQHPLIARLGSKPGRAPAYIPAATFSLALFDTVCPGPAGADIAQVRHALDQLPETSARRALLAIIDSAYGDIARARQGVEDWFNAAMQRLSGEYKRRLLWFTLLVAAIVATVVGADTIALAQSLWQEEGLRAALVSAAQSQTGASNQNALQMLSSLGLPLGWSQLPTTAADWSLKVAGLMLTTLAVSLGAPFWFDFLQQFTNPRSSGVKPPVNPPSGR